MGYRSWSGPARELALAVDAAVSGAQAGDSVAFTDALADLARVDREQLAVVLGAVTRDLLERSHPDGLDTDDAELVLQSALRAASWYEPLDGDAMVLALAGALGIADVDGSPRIGGVAVVAHGLLLIADRLTVMSVQLQPVLDASLRELMRAQTVELP